MNQIKHAGPVSDRFHVFNKMCFRSFTPDTQYVVVSKPGLDVSVARRMARINVPVVSTEWIIQCLIRGVVVNTEGHERYKYDFEHKD